MSNPFVKHDEAAAIADVNVVPLADVSLVLLIILLVLSPMAAQSMLKVQAAAAKAEDPGKPPKAGLDPLDLKPPEPVLAIGLTPLGYVLDGRLLASDAELRTWLMPKIHGRDDKKVFLAPELDVPNGRVVGAIEAIQGCGASTVALVQVADDAPVAGTP